MQSKLTLIAYGPDPKQARSFITKAAKGGTPLVEGGEKQQKAYEKALSHNEKELRFFLTGRTELVFDQFDLLKESKKGADFPHPEAQKHIDWARRGGPPGLQQAAERVAYNYLRHQAEDWRYLACGSGGPLHDVKQFEGENNGKEYFGMRARVSLSPPWAWVAQLHQKQPELHLLLHSYYEEPANSKLMRAEVTEIDGDTCSHITRAVKLNKSGRIEEELLGLMES